LQFPYIGRRHGQFLASVRNLQLLSFLHLGVLGLGQENDVEREFQIHRTERDYALAEFWKWTIALVIGVAMGCIGFVVDLGIEVLNTNKYTSTATVIQSHGMFLSNFRAFPHDCGERLREQFLE
jgi:hypothetical protein